jgi:hypothetical protein
MDGSFFFYMPTVAPVINSWLANIINHAIYQGHLRNSVSYSIKPIYIAEEFTDEGKNAKKSL